jgi:hypothetical protein
MKTPTRRRARFFLILALCLAVAASAAGLTVLLHGRDRAAAASGPAAASPSPRPSSTQARADLTGMQAALNSGSVSAQAALLVPQLTFAPGSGPIVPAGKTITVLPGTLRPDGQFDTVRARVSDGTIVTLGLHLTGSHWRLYAVQAGSAQTRARVAGPPATVRLMSAVVDNHVPAKEEIGTKQPVILIHGWNGDPSSFGSIGEDGKPDPASMLGRISSVPGVWASTFDWSVTSGRWVTDQANGPDFTRYVNRVALASK